MWRARLANRRGGPFFPWLCRRHGPPSWLASASRLMECLNDIAAVGFFGVNTLTLGIYTTWLGEGNLGGAAQLAVVLLIFVFALLWVERHARKQQSYMPGSRHPMAPRRTPLTGWRGILAMLACFLPVFLGFILPALILLKFATRHVEDIFSASYFDAMWHSFVLSLVASLVVVILGLILAYAHRSQRGKAAQHIPPACQCRLCHAGNGARHRRAYSARLFRQQR